MTLKLLLYAVYPYQHHLVQIHSRWIAWVMKPHSEPEGSYNLVGLAGLEPATSSLSVKRSNQLSYRPERPNQTCCVRWITFSITYFQKDVFFERVGGEGLEPPTNWV